MYRRLRGNRSEGPEKDRERDERLRMDLYPRSEPIFTSTKYDFEDLGQPGQKFKIRISKNEL